MKLLVVQCFLFQNSTSYKNIFGSLAMRSGKYSSTKIAFSPILVPKNRSKISSKKQSYWTDRLKFTNSSPNCSEKYNVFNIGEFGIIFTPGDKIICFVFNLH